jgi:hypothetical protein
MQFSRTFFMLAVAAAVLAMVQSTHASPEKTEAHADSLLAVCGAYTQGESRLEAEVRDIKQSIESLNAQLAVIDEKKLEPIKLLIKELDGKKKEKEILLKAATEGKTESCTK